MHVIIAGCGRVGSTLATLLSDEGHDVVVIDVDPKSFRRLGTGFGGITIVGNAFDIDDLIQAGIEKADVFCAVTNLDNTNIMAAQVAKRIFGVNEVISRLYNPERLSTYQKLGISMVCGTVLLATAIKNRVVTPGYDTIHILPTGDVEIIQIIAGRKAEGMYFSDLMLEKEYMPIAYIRDGDSYIPVPGEKIKEKDTILIVTRSRNIAKILKKLAIR